MGLSGKYKNDSLGTRMKEYENAYRLMIPKRTYVMIRIDGKAFHTYTSGLKRPFDDGLIEDMNQTAAHLCKKMMNAKFAYVQSDEISILLSDVESTETQCWFQNNLQKMVSVAASIATAEFNRLRLIRKASENEFYVGNSPDTLVTATDSLHVYDIESFVFAEFDARAWILPTRTEVINYLIWRQQDATRNSISSVAQSLYSHKELDKKSSNEKQELIFQKGINWNDFDSGKKRGRFIERVKYVNGQPIPDLGFETSDGDVVRNRWEVVESPIFTEDKTFLRTRIPSNE